MDTKRLFLAIKIEPDDNFKAVYNGLKTNLRNQNIKWVEIFNFHLTLKFYGETNVNIIPSICQKVEESIVDATSFEININKTGIFGSSYQPKVIWFGIDKNPTLLTLAENVLNNMSIIGFERDRQNFVPHLTIGRIKFVDDKRFFNQIVAKYTESFIQKVEVKEINIYESILRKEGPIYKVVKSFKLKE